MKVLIVGGGVAGLNLAQELLRIGVMDVKILEKARGFHHAGAGIALNSLAFRVLEENGLATRLRERGSPYERRDYLDQEGNLLGSVPMREICEQHGLPKGVYIHRADLHEALAEGLPDDLIHFNTRITSIQQNDEGTRVETAEHGVFEADLLVGADGLHSQVRDEVFGFREHSLHFRAYRTILENPDNLKDYSTYVGIGASVGVVPLNAQQLYIWISVAARPEDSNPLEEGLNGFQRMTSQFTAPALQKAFAQLTSTDSILCRDSYEVTMESWFKGRVVLVGDACHAMSPSMGSGAALALEDTHVLAEELAKVQNGEHSLPLAFDSYYRRRMPRVESLRQKTRLNDYEQNEPDREVCQQRNQRLTTRLLDTEAVGREVAAGLADPL